MKERETMRKISGHKITKKALVADIAPHFRTQQEAKQAVDAVIMGITRNLALGHSVAISGLGKFFLRARPARTARNPRTREVVQAKADVHPSFRAGPLLKSLIKEAVLP